jgi:hypothetical protein
LSEEDVLMDLILKLKSGRSFRLDLLKEIYRALYNSIHALPEPMPGIIKQTARWLRQ